ncbi:PTS sugar transporter subunit IIA [Alkalibacterium putridalgicola]|uniref:PTS sugar transporter subunit IIA n=1 Tax=Alkalibacterium putridalgicola TaxID=426703 RepID=UPI0034CF03B0
MEGISVMDPKVIKTNMQANNKEDALNQLATLLKEAGYISSIEGYLKDVYEREEEGMTGIGNFIAIPHGKSQHVNEIGVAIGTLNEEISWETLDGKGVKGIVLFAVGNDSEGANQHLKLLSLFARKLGNDDVVSSLLNAKNTSEVINAFEI